MLQQVVVVLDRLEVVALRVFFVAICLVTAWEGSAIRQSMTTSSVLKPRVLAPF